MRRRRARSSLLHFTNYTFPAYQAEPAHEIIASSLDHVVQGACRRLMIIAPPQHGKSELVSVRFPPFWLGRRPDDPVILSSYAASLAESKSRHARTIVEGSEFHRLFPRTYTRRDSRAVDHWELRAPGRGGLLAVGVGGPITGHGAMLGIIDDPFENWEQAQSATIRDKVWEWWRTTFRTRIWENGAIVLILTRWHEDDLAGRLLAEQAGDWTVLRLPALAETQAERDDNHRRMNLPPGQPDPLGRSPGEPLCPGRFGSAALDDLRRDVGSLAWNAEYQGAPRAPEGNRFKRGWFKIVDAVPASVRRVRYWDKAGTEGGGAYTAGVLMAVAEREYLVEDVVRGQWSAGTREAIIRQTAELDAQRGPVDIWVEQEPGSGGKESADATIRNLAGFSIRAEPATGNKDARLEPFVAQAEAGNVKLVRGAWNAAYIDEMCAIPNGRFRDQADGSAGAFNKLARGDASVVVSEYA